jgi:hypothetical protein
MAASCARAAVWSRGNGHGLDCVLLDSDDPRVLVRGEAHTVRHRASAVSHLEVSPGIASCELFVRRNQPGNSTFHCAAGTRWSICANHDNLVVVRSPIFGCGRPVAPGVRTPSTSCRTLTGNDPMEQVLEVKESKSSLTRQGVNLIIDSIAPPRLQHRQLPAIENRKIGSVDCLQDMFSLG